MELLKILSTGQYFGKLLAKKELPKMILTETAYPPLENIPFHAHQNFYICYVVKGHYTEVSSKVQIECFQGDIIIHPKEIGHSNIFKEKGAICFNVEIRDSQQTELALIKSIKLFNKGAVLLNNAIRRIYTEFKNFDDFSNVIIEGLLQEAIGYSGREIHNFNPYLVRRAKNIILENKLPDISLSSLAAALHISSSHLAREFKKITGNSIGKYIQELKIMQACEMLKNPQSEILTISKALGFSDQAHFTKSFKKIAGLTPHQYRLSNK